MIRTSFKSENLKVDYLSFNFQFNNFKQIEIIGNSVICTDSLCTIARAGINFYCSPNPLAKVFFGTSCLCYSIGDVASGTALVTSFAGIPVAEWVGSFGARGFNRVGKYALRMGNVTEIANLIN